MGRALFVAVLAVLLAIPATTRSTADSAWPAPGPQLLTNKDVYAVAADLKALLPSLMAKAHIPGLQIALIRDGRMAWRGSFGVRDARTRAAVTDDTIFEAASLTKPFFAYYVMKLADQGALDLDRPLGGYLPPEKIVRFLGHPLEEKGFHREWFEKVTARQVLSHSSGLPHSEPGKPMPLFFEPGTKWKYSARGYFYLQRVVEHLKGDTLDNLMQKEVLDPLGMTRSALVWKPAFETTMASGHDLLGRPEAFNRRKEARAAASLYTTAGDYARFVCAVLNGEGLRPETLKEMTATHIDMDKPKGLGWSLGFGTQSDANGMALWQWGDQGIYRAYAIAYPASRSAVVYLTNSFYGLSVSSPLVARSVGGQALGAVALNYQPYDAPLPRFVWDVQEKGPAAVKDLDRLKRENPGMFQNEYTLTERDWLGLFTRTLQDAGMLREAAALLEYDVAHHPGSGKAAMAAAEADLKIGERAPAARNFELALKATEEQVDAAVVKERLRYVGAIDQPTPADLSGKWSGAMWASDGRTIDLVSVVVEKGDTGYRGTLADTLGMIPAGTKIADILRTGNDVAFTFEVAEEGAATTVRVRATIEGATMKGRWEDVKHGNGGAIEIAWAGR